jgi:hypothetical protein
MITNQLHKHRLRATTLPPSFPFPLNACLWDTTGPYPTSLALGKRSLLQVTINPTWLSHVLYLVSPWRTCCG